MSVILRHDTKQQSHRLPTLYVHEVSHLTWRVNGFELQQGMKTKFNSIRGGEFSLLQLQGVEMRLGTCFKCTGSTTH